MVLKWTNSFLEYSYLTFQLIRVRSWFFYMIYTDPNQAWIYP